VYEHYWDLTARNGETYIGEGNKTATATPENVHMRITNLFNGNKLLGKIRNTSILSSLTVIKSYN
jgi:hypothetical protein